MKRWIFWPLTAAIFLYGFIPYIDKPKLVVFIAVDQGQQSLLKKYNHLFTGGYRWLIDHGIQFENAYHNHGYTTTGPGHYTLASGRYPGKGGIITNQWFDRNLKRGWYCVEDTSSIELVDGSTGRSYKYINNTALGDWVKAVNPNSKVISISGKDRAAVLLGGKNPDMVLWNDKQGGYTTSTYYADSLPVWVKEEIDKMNIPSYIDSTWERILPENVYSNITRADNTYGEADWTMKNGYNPTFPIIFNELELSTMLELFYITPFGDEATIQLGKRSLAEYDMGTDDKPDILFLELSATDGIGHSFGPHSQEQMDNYLRLDRNLGQFIHYIEQSIGEGNVLYVLTSDHGVIALPEYLQSMGVDSGRIPKPTRDSLYTKAMNEINQRIGSDKVYRYGNSFYYANSINSLERKVATDILKTQLTKLEGIRSVITKEDILQGGNSDYQRRLKNMIHPEKSPDIYLIPKKYWTWRYPYGASHGTPYDYDVHVPLIFARGGQKAKVKAERVMTVDIAPTVANILGLDYPKDVDGKVLSIK